MARERVRYEVKVLGYNGHPLIVDTNLGPEGVHYKRVPLYRKVRGDFNLSLKMPEIHG